MFKLVTHYALTVKNSLPLHPWGEIHLLPFGSVAYGFVVCGLVRPILEEHPEKIIELGKELFIKLLIRLCL